MANKNEEFKLKETFLINIKSKSEKRKEKFTKWLQAQSNPQNSLMSLIEHSIDRFGYEDVTDHEIEKRLHTELLYFQNQEELSAPSVIKTEDTPTASMKPSNTVKVSDPERTENISQNQQREPKNVKKTIDIDPSSF